MGTADAPPGFTARPARDDDAGAIADLVNEVNVAEVGVPWTTADDVRTEMTTPGHEPDDDVVLETEDGSIAGYLRRWRDEPLTTISLIAFVPSRLWGRGLSTWLLRSGEATARELVDRERPMSPIHLQVARWAENASAVPLFESLGYGYVRTFYTMRIDLEAASGDPDVPRGIAIRTFDPERDAEPVYRALAEAFQDHWGSGFDTFDVWKHEYIDGVVPPFDPGFWFVALDGDEVVGVACCREGSASAPDAANVDELGVRRGWRGRGIARALLLTAFAEARRRGVGAVELNLDSESPTGATRLYESVGMRPVRSFERWEKLLHARSVVT